MVGALLALTASTALAQGITLRWNHCLAGTNDLANKNSTCLVTTGVNRMIVSYQAPGSITNLDGMDAYIDYQTSAGITCWWNFQGTNPPRAVSLSVAFKDPLDANGDPTWFCPNRYWATKANVFGVGGMALLGNGNARISMGQSVPTGTGTAPAAGEQEGFGVTFDNANAPVANGCVGCLNPACFTLNRVTLFDTGEPGLELNTAITSNSVTWQNGAIGGPGCPAATPTQNKTWGSVKALYR
jgi:hypothetical protein